MRMNATCSNPKTFGSTHDHENKCPRCKINVDKIAANQRGMWFSYSRDRVTGELRFVDRKPESEASKSARERSEKARADGKQSVSVRKHVKSFKVRPSPISTAQNDGLKDENLEFKFTRIESWSSHGHVEL